MKITQGIKYVAEINYPEDPRAIYITELASGDLGWTFNVLNAKTFDTAEIAERVAVSWNPSVEPFLTTPTVVV